MPRQPGRLNPAQQIIRRARRHQPAPGSGPAPTPTAPMTRERREAIYLRQHRGRLTPRQARRLRHKSNRTGAR